MDLKIDNYLAEMIVAIDDLGGRVNLVGLCQGGWVAAMVAARFPDKVNSLVLAGAPIDTDAGDGPFKRMAHQSPDSFYRELVELGGGLMKGKFMLQGWKNMHPEQHYIQDHVDLYEHIEDPAYLKKEEAFESWYENPIDLPGRWYFQVMTQLFKENRRTGLPGANSSHWAASLISATSFAPSTCWRGQTMTSRHPSRSLMPQSISGRQRSALFRRRCLVAISDFSWGRAP